jgi:hypothetical protein
MSMDWPGAFALTLACELPLVLLTTRSLPQPMSLRRVLLVATAANLLTHPLAWRLSRTLGPDDYQTGAALIEAGVIVVEALWYYGWLRTGAGRALGASLLANAASLLTGWLIW